MRMPAWTRSVGQLVLAELRHRYAGSALGATWAILSPLVEVGAYTLVFGLLLGVGDAPDGVGFAFFVASGLLPWSALRESLETASSTLADNRWIRRTRLPLELLVSRVVLASAARAGAAIILVLAYAISRGLIEGPAAVLLPVVGLVFQLLACYGAGLVLAPLTVLYPDLRPGVGSALTLLTFASPILYPESLVPPPLLALLEWNPFTHFLRLYRLPLGPPRADANLVDLVIVDLVPLALVVLGAGLSLRLYWLVRARL